MLQIGRDLDLGQESLAAENGGQLGMEHLDGDAAAVLEVLGQVDRGHAALAQLALDAIPVGQCGGEARSGVGREELRRG